jgi:rhodanese-related sulfurtransferase
VLSSKPLWRIATAIAKVFDLTVASTGLSEKSLRAEGIPFVSSITHSASHAGYYPDDGRLFGAQIVGYDGVDKRVDMIATILKQGGTVYDLQEIEHAYAPPFSSAKDPVNIAGFVAENILGSLVKIVHWHELNDEELSRSFILDGRIIVYCAAGLRAYLACRILSQHGFPEVYNLSGGYKTYAFVTEKQANEDIFAGDVIGKDDNIYQTTVDEA